MHRHICYRFTLVCRLFGEAKHERMMTVMLKAELEVQRRLQHPLRHRYARFTKVLSAHMFGSHTLKCPFRHGCMVAWAAMVLRCAPCSIESCPVRRCAVWSVLAMGWSVNVTTLLRA